MGKQPHIKDTLAGNILLTPAVATIQWSNSSKNLWMLNFMKIAYFIDKIFYYLAIYH